ALNDGMVDLPPVRFPALLAADLLPAVRTLQRGDLADAGAGPRRRPWHSRPAAARRRRAWPHNRRPAWPRLALDRVGLPSRLVRTDQLGRRLLCHRLRGAGRIAAAERRLAGTAGSGQRTEAGADRLGDR